MWFDSHCHLDFAAFDADRDAVWQRARAVGVTRAFLPGVSAPQWSKLRTVQESLSGLCLGVGWHPYFVHELVDSPLDEVAAAVARAFSQCRAVAIGECGLDARPKVLESASLERQLAILERHIAVARELDAPLVVHVVDAHGAAIGLLERMGPLRAGGVLHGYSGSRELVIRYAKLGLSFGFSAAVCRPEARRLGAALRAVPADRLLIETDAPDQLGPERRASGASRNEPAALLEVARAVAALRGLALQELCDLTSSNAERLFSR